MAKHACEFCGGSGEVDSGGFTPWGSPINVRCVCAERLKNMADREDECESVSVGGLAADLGMLDDLSLNTKQLLEELAWSGVEVDDARLDYVVIQVDRCVWESLQAAVRPVVLRVVPAVKYGIYGQMLPCCRGLDTASRFIELAGEGLVVLKQWEEITEDDSCQRGPDGLPLHRVTPLVPYLTLEQWKADVSKRCENK